jgi:hypothetical protein
MEERVYYDEEDDFEQHSDSPPYQEEYFSDLEVSEEGEEVPQQQLLKNFFDLKNRQEQHQNEQPLQHDNGYQHQPGQQGFKGHEELQRGRKEKCQRNLLAVAVSSQTNSRLII